jgi:Protein of unknown function (DUF1236)
MRVAVHAAAIALMVGSSALAQTVGIGSGEPVLLEPEQRQAIKQYVVKENVRPVHTNDRVVIGDTLPSDVELRSVPSNWGPKLMRYKYIYSNSRVYLVDPSDRKVIEDID